MVGSSRVRSQQPVPRRSSEYSFLLNARIPSMERTREREVQQRSRGGRVDKRSEGGQGKSNKSIDKSTRVNEKVLRQETSPEGWRSRLCEFQGRKSCMVGRNEL